MENEAADYAHLDPSSDLVLYASSPERGLVRAIKIMARVRRTRADMRLYVATPGYHDAQFFLRRARRLFGEHVVELGHLSRPELFAAMRRALCVLQPNSRFLESCGLVFAEANVLGTPVLATAIGAVPETVGDPDQLFDPADARRAADRILEWADGARPTVKANPDFEPTLVAERWEDLITRT